VGITGRVTYQDGSIGRECLVYIQVEQVFFGILLKSLPINAMTNGGGYAADIKNIRLAQDFNAPLTFAPDSDEATINVRAV